MTTRIGSKKPHRHFIREWIKAKGLTQTRLAGRMGISQGMVSKFLTKPSALTEKYLMEIAEAMELDVPDLFRDPNMPTQEELLAGLDDEQMQQVVQIISVIRGEHTGTNG